MSNYTRAIRTISETINRDVRRAWKAGAGFIAISRWVARVIGILRRIVLARILGAEMIGHIAVVNAVLSLIRLPAGAGTFPVVTKLVAEYTDDSSSQKEVVGTSLRINSITSALVIAVVFGILAYTNLIRDPVAKTLLYILAFFVPFMVFSGVLRCGLMGQRRMKTVAILDTVQSVTELVIVIPLAIFLALKGWLLNYILSVILGFVLFAWYLRSIFSFRWNPRIAGRVVRIGGFSFLSQILGVLMLQFDTLTVSGVLKDPAATGIYNTAALAVQELMFLPGSILVVVFPFVAQHRDDLPRLKARYRELFNKLLAMTFGAAVLTWIFCPWFFPLFGAEFTASTAPFRVLIFGFIARTLYVLDNTYLEALGRTDVQFVAVALSASATVVLNLILIPRFGVMGAAWATTIAMYLGLLFRQAALRYFIFHKKAIR